MRPMRAVRWAFTLLAAVFFAAFVASGWYTLGLWWDVPPLPAYAAWTGPREPGINIRGGRILTYRLAESGRHNWLVPRRVLLYRYDAPLQWAPFIEEKVRSTTPPAPVLGTWVQIPEDQLFLGQNVLRPLPAASGRALVYANPLWVPTALAAIPALLLWYASGRAVRRHKRNVCVCCGYDRRGLAADAKCPECGMASVRCGGG